MSAGPYAETLHMYMSMADNLTGPQKSVEGCSCWPIELSSAYDSWNGVPFPLPLQII